MAQYSVYRLKDGSGYVVDLQAAALDFLNTRVVAPLLDKREYQRPFHRSNPEFEINGQVYVLAAHFIATIHQVELGEHVVNLLPEDHRITRALDLVFHGI